MVTVITAVMWIAIGVGVVLVIAVVVGIVDAANAPMWRQVARERRQRWESRHAGHHGGVWDDD
ncbi:MAG: hypothetical protein BGP03_04295 [Pseudonocardia sp. 73-21]|nr:MAG: hypothetical protein BGP03_04295 [Pseudonocardia sp. 73-21]